MKDNSSLRYVWAVILCIVLAIVCFSATSVNSNFLYGGIGSLSVAAMVVIIYLLQKLCKTSKGNYKKIACSCCNLNEDDSYCDLCMRTVFCIRRDVVAVNTNVQQSVQMSAITQPETQRPQIRSSSLSPGTHAQVPTPDSISSTEVRVHLRSIEVEIHRLFIEYSTLEAAVGATPAMARLYKVLHREYKRLNRWISRVGPVTESDLTRIRTRLYNVQSQLLAIDRQRLQGGPMTPEADIQNGWGNILRTNNPGLHIGPIDSVEGSAGQNGIITAAIIPMPQPPSYEESLGERPPSLMSSGACFTTGLVPYSNLSINTPDSQLSLEQLSISAHRTAGVHTICTTPSGHINGVRTYIAPPSNDNDAPPPYEEASSSPV